MARPRQFDPAHALDAAMDVFWRNGYEGTSLADLTAATGLGKQSLYGAFGNKQAIYLASLERYEAMQVQPRLDALSAPGDAQTRLARMFNDVIEARCERDDRRGCMLCSAAVDHVHLDSVTRNKVSTCIARLGHGISAAISHKPPHDHDAGVRSRRAQSLLATYFGLQVLARAGAAREVLENVRDAALENL